MAYTSVLPVHRLDRSIDYVKDRTKTTKSAGSLEEAIDYALNREKTEKTIFEDAMGCTCETAYADMVKTKERFHKKDGVLVLCQEKVQIKYAFFRLAYPAKASAFSSNAA